MWPVAPKRLSLYEVKTLGERALFLDHGETLLCENGVLYDLREAISDSAGAHPRVRLPDQVLAAGTGIEFGWRHLLGCKCLAYWHLRAARVLQTQMRPRR